MDVNFKCCVGKGPYLNDWLQSLDALILYTTPSSSYQLVLVGVLIFCAYWMGWVQSYWIKLRITRHNWVGTGARPSVSDRWASLNIDRIQQCGINNRRPMCCSQIMHILPVDNSLGLLGIHAVFWVGNEHQGENMTDGSGKTGNSNTDFIIDSIADLQLSWDWFVM